MNPSFPHHLRYLNLGHMAEHYEAMAAQAAEKSWSPLEYLQRLVEGEYDLRQQRALERRVRAARFPVVKTLDRFDWSWPTKIDELKIRSIFRLGFIAKKTNVIFVGAWASVKVTSGSPWPMKPVSAVTPSSSPPRSTH